MFSLSDSTCFLSSSTSQPLCACARSPPSPRVTPACTSHASHSPDLVLLRLGAPGRGGWIVGVSISLSPTRCPRTRHRPRVRRRVQVLEPRPERRRRLDAVPLKVGEASIEQFNSPRVRARRAPGVRGGFQRSLLPPDARRVRAPPQVGAASSAWARARLRRPQFAASLRVSSPALVPRVFLRDDGLRLGANAAEFRLRRRHLFAGASLRAMSASRSLRSDANDADVSPAAVRAPLEKSILGAAGAVRRAMCSSAASRLLRRASASDLIALHQRPAATLGVRNLRRRGLELRTPASFSSCTAQFRFCLRGRASLGEARARARARLRRRLERRLLLREGRGGVGDGRRERSLLGEEIVALPARRASCVWVSMRLPRSTRSRCSPRMRTTLTPKSSFTRRCSSSRRAPCPGLQEKRVWRRGPQRTRRADPAGGTPWTRGDPGAGLVRVGDAGRDGRRARARPRGPRRRGDRGEQGGGSTASAAALITIAGTTTGRAAGDGRGGRDIPRERRYSGLARETARRIEGMSDHVRRAGQATGERTTTLTCRAVSKPQTARSTGSGLTGASVERGRRGRR